MSRKLLLSLIAIASTVIAAVATEYLNSAINGPKRCDCECRQIPSLIIPAFRHESLQACVSHMLDEEV